MHPKNKNLCMAHVGGPIKYKGNAQKKKLQYPDRGALCTLSIWDR